MIKIFLVLLGLVSFVPQGSIYKMKSGSVSFVSEAPLELIKASSQKLDGIINIGDNKFVFTLPISSFDGFNSGLQKEHFNENYMESSKFPNATFTGVILENINFKTNGEYDVTAKGKLKIHGVEKERTIKSKLIIKNAQLIVTSTFQVPLADHDIKIPKVVNQKIASVINVSIEANFAPK
jgi:polyisoprenoid-binding protein YceI